MQDMHIIGIESSCDDTGVAILKNDGKVLANCIHSQLKEHLGHGGIIPMVAKDYHLANIDKVARRAFEESNLSSIDRDIDAIAVATRPGLTYSLQVGLNYAKQLAKKYSKPLIPIHHMQAHALMPLLENRSIRYPFMTLLLSGGHCLIAICRRFDQFELLGCSSDDAPGDLLDKTARRCRLRNLGSPFDSISGGAAIELLSRRENANRFKHFNSEESIPMLRNLGCDFSFSGYRGTVDKIALQIDDLWKSGDRESLLDELGHLSGSIQRSIFIQVARKLQRAMSYYRMYWRYENSSAFEDDKDGAGFEIRSKDDNEYLDLVVSGGVAANSYLVENLSQFCKQELDESMQTFVPSKKLCSDNGLMIAWNGSLRYVDFLGNREKYKSTALECNIVTDSIQMDSIETRAESPIGLDIRQQVNLATFRLRAAKFREAKVCSHQESDTN